MSEREQKKERRREEGQGTHGLSSGALFADYLCNSIAIQGV